MSFFASSNIFCFIAFSSSRLRCANKAERSSVDVVTVSETGVVEAVVAVLVWVCSPLRRSEEEGGENEETEDEEWVDEEETISEEESKVEEDEINALTACVDTDGMGKEEDDEERGIEGDAEDKDDDGIGCGK